MSARLAADAVVLVHLAFVVFVVVGGFLAIRWPRIAWLHVPAALWGAWAELTATICPLTPLENALRRRAGETGYEGGFIEHYLIPLLYPAGLTPGISAGSARSSSPSMSSLTHSRSAARAGCAARRRKPA